MNISLFNGHYSFCNYSTIPILNIEQGMEANTTIRKNIDYGGLK
jgi:hypothetical protein